MSGNMRLGRGEEGEGRGRIATLTSTRSGWTACWTIFLWQLVIHLCSPTTGVLWRSSLDLYRFFSLLGMFVLLPQQMVFRFSLLLGS
jgi:hypothetical protein